MRWARIFGRFSPIFAAKNVFFFLENQCYGPFVSLN
jgi:hypothetical protein